MKLTQKDGSEYGGYRDDHLPTHHVVGRVGEDIFGYRCVLELRTFDVLAERVALVVLVQTELVCDQLVDRRRKIHVPFGQESS